MLKSLLACALFCSSSAWTQQLSVDFDPAKTEIHWSLAGNVHTTHGTFRLKQGHIAVDPADGAISGDLIADATSGQSGNAARDKHMHNEILESSRFPEIRLSPHKVEGTVNLAGRSTIQVSGAFFIHGATHPVSIPIGLTFQNGAVTATGKFSIPYVHWGIKDPSNFLFKVDKSVDIEIVAVGRITGKLTAGQ